MTLKLVFAASLLDVSIKGQCGEQVYLLCGWKRHLAGFPHRGVVDRWLATPERARYSALMAFSR